MGLDTKIPSAPSPTSKTGEADFKVGKILKTEYFERNSLSSAKSYK